MRLPRPLPVRKPLSVPKKKNILTWTRSVQARFEDFRVFFCLSGLTKTLWRSVGNRVGPAAASSGRTDGEAEQAAAALRAPRQKRGVRCEPESVPSDLEETGVQPGLPSLQTQ